MKEKDEQLLAPLSIILTFVGVIVITTLLSSCSNIEILDGLCYNDKDGTYLCPEKDKLPWFDKKPNDKQTKLSTIYRKPGELQCNKFGMIEYCEGFITKDLKCTCVNHNDMSRITDFLWRP